MAQQLAATGSLGRVAAALRASKTSHAAGIVIGAGKMQRTVKVRLIKQVWNKHLRKYFKMPYTVFAHDANSTVVEGDVVSLEPERHSKHVYHAVAAIVSPFGKPLDQRPPLMTVQEREERYLDQRAAKLQRRMERARLAQQVENGVVTGESDDADIKVTGLQKDGQTPKIEEHGRQVLKGGLHKYGKVNDEARSNKQKAIAFEKKGIQNEADIERVNALSRDEIAATKLREKHVR